MAKRQARPPIGTKMYDVWENIYDANGKVSSAKEYVVVESKVTGFFEGRIVQIHLLTHSAPNGNSQHLRTVPHSHKLGDIGKKVFYTAREAAEYAKELTEKHDRTWSWIDKAPMRRTWEKYLKEEPLMIEYPDYEAAILERQESIETWEDDPDSPYLPDDFMGYPCTDAPSSESELEGEK